MEREVAGKVEQAGYGEGNEHRAAQGERRSEGGAPDREGVRRREDGLPCGRPVERAEHLAGAAALDVQRPGAEQDGREVGQQGSRQRRQVPPGVTGPPHGGEADQHVGGRLHAAP